LKVAEPKNLRPYCQNQSQLFPANLLDFIKDDDLCMVVDDVVNNLDLSCLYVNIATEGNMAYHPKMMLKVLFYAYASGIFSSRKIAKALGENVAFIYLAAWQRPDFRTINNFRKNNLEPIEDLFVQIVDTCQQLKMVKLGHISIDSSKFKANAADRKTYDAKRIEREIKRILDKADEQDQHEDDLYGSDKTGDELPQHIRDRNQRIEKLKQIKQQLEKESKKKLNATDTDAVFMKTTAGIKTAYNAQASVDEDFQVIVAADVTNDPNDKEQLLPIIEQTEQNTDADIDILTADCGYSTGNNLQKLESSDINAYIPDDTYQSRSRGKPVSAFDKDNFIYDHNTDVFTCPEGKVVRFWHTRHYPKGDYRVYRCLECAGCQHFGQCTKSKKGRSIWRRVVDENIKKMRTKLDSESGKAIYAKRKHIIEPVFGHMKSVLGFTGFNLRGLQKVKAEFKIVAIAHNLKKISKYAYKKGIGLIPIAAATSQ
jgi:transposase